MALSTELGDRPAGKLRRQHVVEGIHRFARLGGAHQLGMRGIGLRECFGEDGVDVAAGEEIQLLVDLGELEALPDWERMFEDSVVPKLHDGNGELIWVPMN